MLRVEFNGQEFTSPGIAFRGDEPEVHTLNLLAERALRDYSPADGDPTYILADFLKERGFDAEVVEIAAAPDSPITRKPLSKLDPSYYGKIMIGGIFRDGVWQVAVGDTHIQNNERVIAVRLSPQLKDVQTLFSA